MNGKGLLKDIRVIALILTVLVALALIYVYPAPPADAGINGNLRYGLDLVGGSWLQLKLEGTVAGIDAPISEPEVADFLEQELNAEVVYYKGEDVTVYEIRKSVSKDELVNVLQEIDGSLVTRGDGTDFFEEGVTQETRDETRRIIDVKLNLLGLADTNIRTVGNNFILVDLAGVDIGTAKSIVGKPGKFEIRIQTAGTGSDLEQGMRFEVIENITAHVVFGSEGIESKSVGAMPVRESENSPWGAAFTLTEKGATALQEAALEYGATDNPVDHELAMLLDDVVIYSAPLSPELAQDLKEKLAYALRAETGLENEGFERAKELIIHLKAGVLPVNVEIIGSGEVPAYLGAKFKEESLIAGFTALLFVALVVFLRYRERRIVLPMFFTLLSEVILIAGFAAAISWQLDLPSIAGIIAVIGTGVDQLVIISDEVISGGRSSVSMYRKRISFAFGIIFASAATTIVAMFALALLALGTLRGFAIVTIVGLVIGIFITRPAYARMIEELL
ncbi:MAG TPA: preprotein translocase subunit SecD [Desulfobacteria bacterium]|nr:preprotein translocase subunit SecD [Desulfobacteria bacterium]